MSNTFQVGKQYKLSGTPITDKAFQEALDTGVITVPEVWTCNAVHHGGAWSSTKGVLFQGMPATDEEGWFIATTSLLNDGTIVEVTDAS